MREPFYNYINNHSSKRPESTKYERLLASALDSFAEHIDYKTNREVRLLSCTWYTPDFIMGLVTLPDRIRQRAIENMGYKV
jgi:hypothetical protein